MTNSCDKLCGAVSSRWTLRNRDQPDKSIVTNERRPAGLEMRILIKAKARAGGPRGGASE